MKSEPTIFTLASFNLQNFNAAIKKEFVGSKVNSVDYEQMLPFLLGLDPVEDKKDICICWVSVKDVIQANELKLDLENLLLKLNQSFQYVIVVLPAMDSPAFNLYQGATLRNQIYQLNAGLSEKTMETNTMVLDSTPWLIKQGSAAVSSQLWYLSKTPFHKNVFREAANACFSAWCAFVGHTKKVLIVDLDDTLWGGIVGDDGLENLKIGGHDPLGEAYVDFQNWIHRIKSWGVILCIASKNDEKVALDVFDRHDGMILKREDFVMWRINWNDKAANIAEIIKELNVGIESVVFLDDNAAERDRVRTALPGIVVPNLPDNKLEYPAFIRSLNYFNKIRLTTEDKNRTSLYQQEQNRAETVRKFISVDDWIKSLNIQIEFEGLNDFNITRVEQLLNKTNQMNLRTRRMNKEEITAWASQSNHWFYAVHVKDVFGDNGITGLIGFHKIGNEFFLDDFVMSCRIMGRRIENAMLEFILDKLKSENATKLWVEYIKTERNQPILNFFTSVAPSNELIGFS